MRVLHTIYSTWAILGAASANSPQTKTIDLVFCAAFPGCGGSGHIFRSSEPGKRAHAFRMTLVSRDKLPQIKDAGLNVLVKAIKDMVFPQKNLEAKELYDIGHQKTGLLCRQRGESMLSFTGRRKRWYRLLNLMDKDIALSEQIQGDLLLDCAGISKQERLLVLTSTSNSTAFADVSQALLKQHGKIHLDERGQRRDGGLRGLIGPDAGDDQRIWQMKTLIMMFHQRQHRDMT